MFSVIRVSLCLLLLISVGCNRLGEPPQYAFARFKKAVDEADAVAMSGEVSQQSIVYLNQIETWVLRGKPEQVETLGLFDRFLVLRVRMLAAEWSKGMWEDYSESVRARGEEELGSIWLPLIQNHFLDFQLGKVKYYEGIAGGPLLLGAKEVDTRIRFFKEETWKVDLVGFLRDEFEAVIAEYMGDDFRNRNRVDAYLKADFGESFSKDLYREHL